MKSLTDCVNLESVRDNWKQIVDMEGGDFPTSNQEATMEMVGKLSPLTQGLIEEESTDVVSDSCLFTFLNSCLSTFMLCLQSRFVGFESEPFDYTFDSKDVILYALGVGASTDDANGLAMLYEGCEQFAPLTSFGVIPAMGGLTGLVSGKVPGLNIDLSKVCTDVYNCTHLYT